MTIQDTVCNFNNLYKAMWQCSKNIKWKNSVIKYLHNGLLNTYKLEHELSTGAYHIGGYTKIMIHEPKERKVLAARLKDRNFQRSLCSNYLYHEITRHFIYDNLACQKHKGTSMARERMKVHFIKSYREYGLGGYAYVFDLHNFFGGTSHTVAKQAVKKHVTDTWAAKCVYDIIDSFDGDCGIGLGSEISQLVELCVLDDLDHMIKEDLHIKHYLRYMDDFVIMHNDKAYLKYCYAKINDWMASHSFQLNTKKTHMVPLTKGFKWLGFYYHMTSTGKIIINLPKKNIRHERRKLKKLCYLCKNGTISKDQLQACFESWKAHAMYGNNHYAVIKMTNFYNDTRRSNNV